MDSDPHLNRVTTYTYEVSPSPPSFDFVHDRERRVFRLTGPEETTEFFRADPVRYLVVEPDPTSGEMKPVLKYGRPAYLYLCREEREVR
jgi:hypothetical protein